MFGFNTAVKGLLASQRALYVTNHNINNVNTKGYSRQKALQRATNAHELPGIGMLGTGTEIYDVVRVRDSFVDFKYWNESAPEGEWRIKRENLVEIEKLMGEPSDNSFRKYMDDFFAALEEMSTNPSDYSYREPVRETALAFTKHINEVATRLDNMKKEIEYSVETKVFVINDIADQIASLNRQIYALEIDGKSANDLRDQREILVDELSKIVNVQVDEYGDGKYRVSISGISLVDHDYVSKIEYVASGEDNNQRELKWENGNKLNLKSGELKGLMDVLIGNGENNSYRGIPFYQNRLDEFAIGFAEKFNEVHNKGYILNSNEPSNIDFFAFIGDEKGAATLTLSQDILDNLDNIAAGKSSGAAENNGNLLELIALREDKSFFNDLGINGTPSDYINSILSNLAVDSMQSKRMLESQNIILKNIERKRESIQGVSFDEEFGDMINFQNAYVASARMITTLDTILEVTINRLGLVGR